MKKILAISVVMLLLIGVAFVAVQLYSKVTVGDVPKSIPIVQGDVLSVRATRSDDFTRGLEVVINTDRNLQDVVKYYSDEFVKRGFRQPQTPPFQSDSSETVGMGETPDHLQVVVFIRGNGGVTTVTVQIKGNSILFLPS